MILFNDISKNIKKYLSMLNENKFISKTILLVNILFVFAIFAQQIFANYEVFKNGIPIQFKLYSKASIIQYLLNYFALIYLAYVVWHKVFYLKQVQFFLKLILYILLSIILNLIYSLLFYFIL